MIINPHITCAQVLDTLKKSGLTYTLNETPYSVYLTLRKKFIKEYLHTGTQHAHGNRCILIQIKGEITYHSQQSQQSQPFTTFSEGNTGKRQIHS